MSTFEREWLPNTAQAFGALSADQVFRNAIIAISDGLSAVGLVQTTDSGQINKATVINTQGSGSITRGYEMFRFNDALQSTRPVFFKIEYGVSANGSGFMVFISVGTATDGAGNFTSLTSSRLTYANTSGNATAYSPLYLSGDTSSVGMVTTRGFIGQSLEVGIQFFVERSRNPDGTPNGDGVWFGGAGSNPNHNAASHQFLSFTNNLITGFTSNYPNPFPAARLPSSNSGTGVVLVPAMVVTPKAQGPSLLMLACGSNDFVRGSMVQALTSGALHTYLSMNGSSNPARTLDGGTPTLLMRWE